MLFRLALALGKTVSELGQSLTYNEFRQWCTFYQIEPWGDYRADLRAAHIAAAVKNLHAATFNETQDWEPADFMPYLDQRIRDNPESAVTPEQSLTDEELAVWADAVLFGIAPDNP